jgi:hypothetical protein
MNEKAKACPMRNSALIPCRKFHNDETEIVFSFMREALQREPLKPLQTTTIS